MKGSGAARGFGGGMADWERVLYRGVLCRNGVEDLSCQCSACK